jgi:lysophospholipase L1-like esterase
MKRIVSFGDSFTVGLGTNRVHEQKIFDDFVEISKDKARQECSIFRRKNSFTQFLSDNFKCDNLNLGESGCSNKDIMNNVFNSIDSDDVTSDDFVIIAFTSSLRDTQSFFPEIVNKNRTNGDTGIAWSKNELSTSLNSSIEHLTNDTDVFMTEYRKLFITELYDEYYYSMYNQNIILILQKYLEYNNIEYIMVDAFESMLYSKDYDKINLIDKTKYWEFDSKTISSFLREFNDISLFEKDKWVINELVSKHPSTAGHRLFADELYRYINEKR